MKVVGWSEDGMRQCVLSYVRTVFCDLSMVVFY